MINSLKLDWICYKKNTPFPKCNSQNHPHSSIPLCASMLTFCNECRCFFQLWTWKWKWWWTTIMIMMIHWKYIIGNMFWFKKFQTQVNLNYFVCVLFLIIMKIRHIVVTVIYTVILGMGGQTSPHTQIMLPPAGLRFPTFLNYVGVVWLLHCLPQQAVEQNLTAASDLVWLNSQVTSL